MKFCLLTTVLLLITQLSWTQNTYLDYKHALKIYNLTSFEEQFKTRRINDDTTFNRIRYATTTLRVLHPTIAFQWKTSKNNFHEIELTNLIVSNLDTKTEFINDTTSSNQIIAGSRLTTMLISIRYEYILNFNKSKDTKFVPSLGFGFNPYFSKNNNKPFVSNIFPTTEIYTGFRTFINPRLTYYLSSKLFMDLNIPLCLFDTFYFSDMDSNPSIPLAERTVSSFNFNQFPKVLSVRLGVGLKL